LNCSFAFSSLFICLFAAAQYPSVSFNNISINQGLSQSSVVSIAFDDKGFVWLATQDGLNRFDGKEFSVLDRQFDDITSGSFSRLGKVMRGSGSLLWIISKGGQLEKLDLINNRLEPINLFSGRNKLMATCFLPEDDIRLWIGTESGKLILYDSKINKIIREISVPGINNQTAINSLFKDSQNQLWIVGSGVAFLNKDQLVFHAVFEDKDVKPGTCFTSIAEDKSGNIWLGSLGQGLFLKERNKAFRSFKTSFFPLPVNLVIEDILADDDGRIWIGTYGKGLFIMDLKEKKLQQFLSDKKKPFSVAFNDVLTIKQDKSNGIWIGTDGGGVSYYNKRRNNFLLLSDQTVPEDIEIAMVRSIAIGQHGVVWAGTSSKGLTRIDYQNQTPQYKTWYFPSYTKNISNPDRVVSLFVDPEGIVWLGTQGNGLILFDSKREEVVKWFHPQASHPLKIPDATAWCIYPSSSNEIWVGTESSGLSLFHQQKGFIDSYTTPFNTSGITDAIRCIEQIDDSTLCIGFAKTSIQLFNTKTKKFKFINSRELENFFAAETTVKSLY
jgi:ligand-binding sensor domain-containing protein